MPAAVDLKVNIFEEPTTRSMSPKVKALTMKDRVPASPKVGLTTDSGNEVKNYVNLPDPDDKLLYRDFPKKLHLESEQEKKRARILLAKKVTMKKTSTTSTIKSRIQKIKDEHKKSMARSQSDFTSKLRKQLSHSKSDILKTSINVLPSVNKEIEPLIASNPVDTSADW